jgi:hypothetical protein
MESRRTFLTGLLLALSFPGAAFARPGRRGPAPRAAVRRKVRRKVRRRHRRRVAWRTVGARKLLVVPVAAAVGWELMVDDQVVTVTEVTKADDSEVFVVRDSAGKTQQIIVVREDDKTNSAALEGSQLPDGDTSTPGVEATIEVEE